MNPIRWAKAEVLHFAWKQGRYLPPDRRLLETAILPALAADPANQRILSVGVAWYTESYPKAFGGRFFATLDLDPSRAELGSANHVVGDVCDLERLFAEPFDVILLNGVIGYGLDRKADVDRALRACAARLRAGGTLVIGINEERPTNVDPASVDAAALFAPRALGEWRSGRVTVDLPFREPTHTFLFWEKKA